MRVEHDNEQHVVVTVSAQGTCTVSVGSMLNVFLYTCIMQITYKTQVTNSFCLVFICIARGANCEGGVVSDQTGVLSVNFSRSSFLHVHRSLQHAR